VRVNAFGVPVFNSAENQNKRKKIKRSYYITFHSNKKQNAPKDFIVIYDIPHEKKRERDWFRRQLKNLGFIMVQISVWVGPSPLPKEFIDYVKFIGLKNQLKTFKLAKPYTEKSNIL